MALMTSMTDSVAVNILTIKWCRRILVACEKVSWMCLTQLQRACSCAEREAYTLGGPYVTSSSFSLRLATPQTMS